MCWNRSATTPAWLLTGSNKSRTNPEYHFYLLTFLRGCVGIQVHSACQGILIIAHVASTPLKPCQKLIPAQSAPIIQLSGSLMNVVIKAEICSETVGWWLKFSSFSCANKPCACAGSPRWSMTGLPRALRTRSCISPTTVWTKRAAIMSGKPRQWPTCSECGAVFMGSLSDSSIDYNSAIWNAFLPFQLRWPWNRGLWEQVEYECSAEVFEARGEGHHMWVKPSPFSLLVTSTQRRWK